MNLTTAALRYLRGLLALASLVVSLGSQSITPALAGASLPSAEARRLPPQTMLLPPQAGMGPGQSGLVPTAGCGYTASTAELLASTSAHDWLSWVEQLSGAEPVVLAGETYTITTRYTPKLFDGSAHIRAYDYILQQVQSWGYPAASIEQDTWTSGGFSGMNLVLTIPGQITPTQVVALTAHLDSLSPFTTRETLAPGAEDNASGSAALLEAARLFRHYQFDRTVKIIWFTGEEQGMLGSGAYANDHSLSGYQGVVNLDMFGYDGDNDRCMELHVGTLAASDAVGECYLESVQAYSLGLSSDYITSGATTASDHAPFWNRNVGAVLVHQNGFNAGAVCGPVDHNPYYHTVNDTVANSYPPYNAGQPNPVGADIARAGLAAVLGMAGNRGACFSKAPLVTLQYFGGEAHLSWTPLSGAGSYRLYRRVNSGLEELKYSGSDTEWSDLALAANQDHYYRVEAVAAEGVCLSQSGMAVLFLADLPRTYLPMVKK